jgi:hypothetical protein
MKDLQKIKEFFSKPLEEAKTGIDMAKKQLDALGVKYEMSKTDKVRPFKVIYKPINKSDKFYDKFEDIVDLFNLKGVVKTSMNEAKSEDKVDTITMDVPLFIRMLEYSREDAAEDMDLHDVTEKAISLGKERGILQMDDYDEIIGAAEKINETRFSKPTGSPYEQKDLYAQELFGTEYFNWLDFWEQFHIVQKYELDKSIITKEGKEYNPDQEQLDDEDEIFMSYDDEGRPLEEAYVPSNIKDFAKRKGVSALVNKVAGWAERVGKGIRGGTAIGKNYSTLILDMGYQTADIYINTEDETIELYGEPVRNFNEFERVYLENKEGNLEERIAEALDKINEELCPAGKAYIKRRKAAGEKSSAYLSGRAVKVCKGQMSGTSKKKK